VAVNLIIRSDYIPVNDASPKELTTVTYFFRRILDKYFRKFVHVHLCILNVCLPTACHQRQLCTHVHVFVHLRSYDNFYLKKNKLVGELKNLLRKSRVTYLLPTFICSGFWFKVLIDFFRENSHSGFFYL